MPQRWPGRARRFIGRLALAALGSLAVLAASPAGAAGSLSGTPTPPTPASPTPSAPTPARLISPDPDHSDRRGPETIPNWPGYGDGAAHDSYNATAQAVTPANARALVSAWTWMPDPPPIPGLGEAITSSHRLQPGHLRRANAAPSTP